MFSKSFSLKKADQLSFSDCATKLVTLSRDVFMWDVKSRKKVWKSKPLKNPCKAVFDPSGQFVAIKNTEGRIATVDTKSGQTICVFDMEEPREGSNVFVTPDGNHLINGTWEGHLELYSTRRGKLLDRVVFQEDMITRISPIPNSNGFAVLHGRYGRKSISVFENGFASKPVTSMTINHDTKNLAMLTAQDYLIASYSSIWTGNRDSWNPIFESDEIIDICVSPDHLTAAVAAGDEVFVIGLATGCIQFSVEIPYASAVEFSNEGTLLAVGSGKSGLVLCK